MQKGQSLIIILVGILIIAGVVGGAYYLGKSSTSKSSPGPVVTSPASTQRGEQTPQPTPSPFNETIDWKTYTNGRGGYSISYPNDYALHIDDELVYGGGPVVEIYPTNSTWPPSGYSISIAVEKNTKNLSLDQPRQLFGIGPLIQYEQLPINWSVKNTYLGGLPAVRVDHCCGGQYGIEAEIKTIRNNFIYELVVTPDYDIENTKPDDQFYRNLRDLNKKKVYENIISTFKFISSETSSE